jgi:hypothetical protein
MKNFFCPVCTQVLSFENTLCLRCNNHLGYDPNSEQMLVLPAAAGLKQCRNYTEEDVCNWLVSDDQELCVACRLNRTIPDLSIEGNRQRWYRLEVAKRRLLYTLLAIGLTLDGLQFDLLVPVDGPVLTGHANGLITINAAEADDATREKMRVDMNEPYRTLVGHFRHESAHFYWDKLIRDSQWLEPFRREFGDDRADYQAALDKRYQEGPPPDWQDRGFISAYASVHPWEDWAETWAHYLHMLDTLETAHAFGLALGNGLEVRLELSSPEQMFEDWARLTFALNSINRSMGISDLYPFVLSAGVQRKLAFIHRLLRTGTKPG